MYATLKKKFSQNFLIDKNVLKKISNLIAKKNLEILEIGPGDGRLTDYVLNFKPKNLILIEIDIDLIPILKSKYNNVSNIKILNNDIMNYNLKDKIDLIISNLPYNISSQILVKICLMNYLPNKLILMFQKEFAQRLLDKKLNSLNALVGCFYQIDHNFNVGKNCFRPIPKIDSTVLMFSKRNIILLKDYEIQKYIEFKRNLFSHKRKTLNHLLKNFNFKKDNLNLNRRVEELSLIELLNIFRETNL